MGEIFFEKQEGMLCAQHALNNLLQGPYFSAVDLAEIARKLDDLERSVMSVFDRDLSLNVNDDGYFSVQVISEALKVFDLRLVGLSDFQTLNIALVLCSAFICNFENHWFTLRRIGGRWFNLNSLNSSPAIISDSHLELFLAQLTAEGCTIFVVEGELPHCPADDVDNSGVNEVIDLDPRPLPSKPIGNMTPRTTCPGDYVDDSDEDLLKALVASREAADSNDLSLQKVLLESQGLTKRAVPRDVASATGRTTTADRNGLSSLGVAPDADADNGHRSAHSVVVADGYPSAAEVRGKREAFLRRFEVSKK